MKETMHNCEEFRERITEHIIDREDIAGNEEFHHDLLMCSSCSEFYGQSREMIETLDSVDLTISENEWNGIESRLWWRLHGEQTAPLHGRRKPGDHRTWLRWRSLIAAAAVLVVTVGLSKLPFPRTGPPASTQPSEAVYVEHSVPLDPVTIDFLKDSELLLRNVMKMAPSDAEDLADAKKVASQQLVEMEQRKEAVADVPPVVDVMQIYETVLRDLRNVDRQSADEDISDIQKRIQRNGLIANMKAFQPRVTEVGLGLR
jgi:hypothetical protein